MSEKDKDELRDTGRQPKFQDEKAHMSKAHIFDTLVETNVALVKALKTTIFVMVAFGFIATMMTGFSAIILRMGQQETRELILAISRKECFDGKTSTRKD